MTCCVDVCGCACAGAADPLSVGKGDEVTMWYEHPPPVNQLYLESYGVAQPWTGAAESYVVDVSACLEDA